MEGWMVCTTKMHAGYTWRLTRYVTEKCTSYTWNVTRNLDLEFIENSSTPWHGAVDQDWGSKSCAQEQAS